MSTTASQSFFNPTDAFGGFTGWEIQTDNPQNSSTRAQQLGADGDEIGFKQHDAKTTVTQTYTATSDTAAIPKIGQIKNGYHIDSIAIALSNTDFAKMTVVGHKHGSASHDTCRTYTGTLTALTSKFGCPSTVVGMTIPTGAGVRSMNYSFGLQHVDENGSQGDHLAGDNYDAVETCDVELCDAGTITANTQGGWCLTGDGINRGNTIAQSVSATAEHHVAHDVVNGGGGTSE